MVEIIFLIFFLIGKMFENKHLSTIKGMSSSPFIVNAIMTHNHVAYHVNLLYFQIALLGNGYVL
jgi:hypothetical protein